MATHALGSGTVNLPINFKAAERNLLGQVAFPKVQSGEFRGVGDYIRHLVLLGLEVENPDAAQKIRAIRNGAGSVILAALLLAPAVFTWFGFSGSEQARRASSVAAVRIRANTRTGRQEMEIVTI
jgi:hypothetical protein